MAEETGTGAPKGSNTAIVAIVVLLVIAGVLFFLYKGGMLKGRQASDMNINLPGETGEGAKQPSEPLAPQQ